MRMKVLLGLSLALLFLSSQAFGAVSPASIVHTLGLGDTATDLVTVTVPGGAITALDLMFVVDLSGSFNDDLVNFKAQAGTIVSTVAGLVPDTHFGLASFEDFPIPPYGYDPYYGDRAYRLNQGLTGDQATIVSAINASFTRYGGDGPQSQYAALWGTSGRDWDENGDGDVVDVLEGDIDGQDPGFRSGALKMAILWTDASFHNADDESEYPGPGATAVTAAMVADGMQVAGVSSGGGGVTELDALALATGAVDGAGDPLVFTISGSGATIGEAIADAVTGAIADIEVSLVPVGDDFGMTTSITPLGSTTVSGEFGGSVDFSVLFTGSGNSDTFILQALGDGSADLGAVDVTINAPSAVPEPGVLLLLATGLAGIAGYGKLGLRLRKKE
jgi:hypothetical protein